MEEWGFAAGDEVELRGLSKLELNGQRGTVLSLESPEQARQLGRLAVMMHSGKQLSLKVSNLLKVTHRSHGSACDLSLHSRRKLVSTPVNHAPQLAVMTFNLQHLANFPKDPSIARRRLMELTSGRPPDLIAIQEGLEGIDLLAQVGYSKLISSAVKAVPLREALYGDEAALEALPAIAHESLMVNEFYLRSDEECAWQLEGTGVEQISSAVSLGDDPIVPRSVIWAK
ncbi:Hypersensitive-induced response protein 3, partial [Durusdinium trenchii]